MGRVVVTDHDFPNLNQEREILGAAGHELVFDGSVFAPDAVRVRVTHAAVRQAGEQHAGLDLDTPTAVFAALRAWKDVF